MKQELRRTKGDVAASKELHEHWMRLIHELVECMNIA